MNDYAKLRSTVLDGMAVLYEIETRKVIATVEPTEVGPLLVSIYANQLDLVRHKNAIAEHTLTRFINKNANIACSQTDRSEIIDELSYPEMSGCFVMFSHTLFRTVPGYSTNLGNVVRYNVWHR